MVRTPAARSNYGMRLAWTCVGTCVLALAPRAWADLPDPVDPSTIEDGASIGTSGAVLGETVHGGEGGLDGEAALDAAWTNSGIDRTEGFRGPRWTNRWGARMSALAAAGSGDRPVAVEQRGEVALYAGSIGQTVTWQSQPRLTDPFWYRASDRLTVGGFADFAGIGVNIRDRDDEIGCEGFPIHAAVARDASGGDATTLAIDVAVTRVAGRRYDARIWDEHVTYRESGGMYEAAALSIRRFQLDDDPSWTLSLDIFGASAMSAYVAASAEWLSHPRSIMPYGRIGIAHHGESVLRAERSEIGRPIVDDTDFGAELGTLHRLVDDAGIDDGGQLLAWWRRAVDRRVVVRGEAMVGVADRVLAPEMVPPGTMPKWGESSGLVYIARGEAELTAQLARGFAVQARAWSEHSERAAPGQPARWTSGVQAGVAWQL
jgi:hypothetical protein